MKKDGQILQENLFINDYQETKLSANYHKEYTCKM